MVPNLYMLQLLVLCIDVVRAVYKLQGPQAGWDLHATDLSVEWIVGQTEKQCLHACALLGGVSKCMSAQDCTTFLI